MPKAAKAAKAAPKTKKGKVAKKEKDPNAPKRPTGAYIYFSNDKRPELKKQHSKWGVAEIGKELGRMWGETDDAGKKKYNEMAAKDKERYTKQLAEYNAKQGGGSDEEPKAEKEEKEEEDGEDEAVEDEED